MMIVKLDFGDATTGLGISPVHLLNGVASKTVLV